MDMRISGSGVIPSGEYDKIRVSGSCQLDGLVRCKSFHVSGATRGGELECSGDVQISGSSKFVGGVKAGSLSISGAFMTEGDLTVDGDIHCSGSAKCGGNVKCVNLVASGGLNSGGDVEAETVNVRGKLNCVGLLNAEEITIEFERGMTLGSIGGSKIAIFRATVSSKGKKLRLPLLSSLVKSAGIGIIVENSIEGDTVAIEDVTVNSVSGRIVAIGDGCTVNHLQYSEQLEVSPDSLVKNTEKL